MQPLSVFQPERKSEEKVVIAHISDLHFKSGTNPQEAVWKALVQDLTRQDTKIDILAVTGDVIDSSVGDNLDETGVSTALQSVKQYLLDLCTALTVDPQSCLLVVPGNHDFRMKGLIWKDYLFDLFFREFAEQFTSRLLLPLGISLFVFDSNTRDRSVAFATGLVSEADLVDHAALTENISPEHKVFWGSSTRVVLVHHHPMPIAPTQHRGGLNTGGEEFMLLKNAGLFMEQMVRTRMDLILHGHRHYPAFSRVSFPTTEGPEHSIAIVAAGSVGKNDDHPFSYNLITISRSGELSLERRVLKSATYESDIKKPISNYAVARANRFNRGDPSMANRMGARKYVRIDTIKRGSGDAVTEEKYYDASALGDKPVHFIARELTSKSGVFGWWTYDAPAGRKIEWKWDGLAKDGKRTGKTEFKPPLDKNPITFTRRGTVFNAIQFNQRDRLDTTEGESSEESAQAQTRHAIEQLFLQISFPEGLFPTDFRLEVTNGEGTRDVQEEDFARPYLTQVASSRTVQFILEKPQPNFVYRIVWDLLKDEIEELGLTDEDSGFADEIIKHLLEVRKPGNARQAQVNQALADLKQEILSAPAFHSPIGDVDLDVELFAYDVNVRGLVCVTTTGVGDADFQRHMAEWVIKPGKFVVGQAFRRREEVLYINVGGGGSEAANYYEAVPGLEGLPPHTVIFAIPLFYPVQKGRKVAAVALASRSSTSVLLRLGNDRAALRALMDEIVKWYMTKLSPAIGLGMLPAPQRP